MAKHVSTTTTITGTPKCDNCGKVLVYAGDENSKCSAGEQD